MQQQDAADMMQQGGKKEQGGVMKERPLHTGTRGEGEGEGGLPIYTWVCTPRVADATCHVLLLICFVPQAICSTQTANCCHNALFSVHTPDHPQTHTYDTRSLLCGPSICSQTLCKLMVLHGAGTQPLSAGPHHQPPGTPSCEQCQQTQAGADSCPEARAAAAV